jgi:hypothetical protein
VQAFDRFRKQRGGCKCINFCPYRIVAEPERRHGVGHHQPVDCRIGQHVGGARHEQPMRHQGNNAACARLARGACGAQQRVAGADQIVDDQRGCVGDIADK